MSFSRLIFLAAIVGVAAYMVPKFAPQLVDRLAAVQAPASEEASGPARIIEVAPPSDPVPATVEQEPRGPRKIAGGTTTSAVASSGSGGGVTLRADNSRHYSTEVRINGVRVDVLVDTGATFVSLTEETARRLGIFVRPEDFTARSRTANGIVAVAPVMLREIRLGSITLRDVQATVSGSKGLGVNLLGMSFLGRLSRFTVGNDEMVLRQ